MKQGEHTHPGKKTLNDRNSSAATASTAAFNENMAAIMLFNTDRRFTITE